MELFSSDNTSSAPLADRMRPRTLDEFAGQDHIVGPGRLLRRVIQADQLSSLIFYGPPGTGKTTLARVIAGSTKSHFITLNAVLSGVKQLRESIDEAREKREYYGRRTTLFIDEVHRWNKAQQDALLPWVENGTVILIGATTENPYFEVNSALVSRSRIFQLKPLSDQDLYRVAEMALEDPERGYGRFRVSIDRDALDHLVQVANGDARTLLNALELAVETTPESFPPPEGTEIRVNLEVAEESIQRKAVLYDKEGDYHFDTISAFIKSVRGSDPDAALYWLARMVKAGEDPRFIFRRMLISASEDIGLADPRALVFVQSAAAAFDRVGLPEGQYHLAQAVLYLATAPKSNSCLGYFDALNSLEEENIGDIPRHLKDPGRDAKAFGHGQGYQYPHAYRDHWVAQQYLPAALTGRVFYMPGDLGHEGALKPLLQQRREEQIAASLEDSPEVLTYSPGDRRRERWANRTVSGAAAMQKALRDGLFDLFEWQRHWRVLDIAPGNGLFMTEALRRCPEGGIVVCAADTSRREVLEHLASELPAPERPLFLAAPFPDALDMLKPGERRFEVLMGRDSLIRSPDRELLFRHSASCLQPGGRLILAEIMPREGSRLSELLSGGVADPEILAKFRQAEEAIYADPDNPLVNWSSEDIGKQLKKYGFVPDLLEKREHRFEQTLTEKLIHSWFDPGSGGFGARLGEFLLPGELRTLKETASRQLAEKKVPWKRTYLLLACRMPAGTGKIKIEDF
ncbi:AAA family ATPase [Marispirochaeta aestuarii]|uniref:Replication-associated recombination protein A n=1 Tax=Marispirochaeta aestuarii TaxID=1963862 RepID=A0A1Y1S066_9SPIO|nr:AAA family ATPase [Marispirochaeta aestuarii]ORC36566.1 AAA family ATPase [Marispirochaeta aestuarii]